MLDRNQSTRMYYNVQRRGQDLGSFSLEELHRRRSTGELDGHELVWTPGMDQWQPLQSVLNREEPDALAPGFLQNWIDSNYEGTLDTNLPPLKELATKETLI